MLRTNTDLDPLAAMLRYKQLWTVEATFRTAKHLLATRPIFHKLDETIRGHVFCSFLALVLKSELEQRIAALGRDGSWSEILADLDSLTETEIAHDGRRFLVRSSPAPRRQPRAPRRRRRPAADRPGPSPPTDPPPQCSATPRPRRRLPFAFSYLAKATVEDGSCWSSSAAAAGVLGAIATGAPCFPAGASN